MVIHQYDVGIRPPCHDLPAPGQLQSGRLRIDAPDLEQPIEFHDHILHDPQAGNLQLGPRHQPAISPRMSLMKLRCPAGR